jgi:diguanylate cyclase (GGDEF)-like protein
MGTAPDDGFLATMVPLATMSGARVEARAKAYEMVELSQAECTADRITEQLEFAEAHGWHEVVCLLHYAHLVRVMPSGGDPGEDLTAMFAAAAAAGDPALMALCLATRAEHAGYHPIGQHDEGTLARAVAMLDDVPSPSIERSAAYIACGLAYQARGLWELEQEMYIRAQDDVSTTLPAPLDRVQAFGGLILMINRWESQLAAACALFELGEREQARAQAAQELPPRLDQLRGFPARYTRDVVAVRHLLAAIAGRPEPEPFERSLILMDDPLWPGYRACILLGLAVRRLDGGDPTAAAELAEQALPDLDANYLPTVRTFGLHLSALAAGSPSALRYAAELARLRWRSRLRLLASSRARLEAERAMLENERLARHAYVDELTGLANRHDYTRRLAELQRARSGQEIAVLMVDIDRFKLVNDRYGHVVGDDVLRRIGGLLRERSRGDDLVARVGGDEFVIVFRRVRAPQATVWGERLVRATARQPWDELADGLQVSISVGVSFGPADRVEDLLAAADRNLYRAKAEGRGRLIGPGGSPGASGHHASGGATVRSLTRGVEPVRLV